MCRARSDFSKLNPLEERNQARSMLESDGYQFYNEDLECLDYGLYHTPHEANNIVQSMHRYKLFVFSNFLTTVGTVQRFEKNIIELLRDASTGSAVLVIGGKRDPYPDIYEYVDRLADDTGFKCILKDTKVKSADSKVSDRVFDAGVRFYKHLISLYEENSDSTKTVRDYFTSTRRKDMPASHIRVYRKPGSRG